MLVDCDADGMTSASIILNYLTKLVGEDYARQHFNYILHTGKQHGLADVVEQFPANCLIILPDSSTNDVKEMQQLLDNGCSIICADHHEADEYLDDSDNLVIINNQICNYPNKAMSAAGVIWQICRAWDEIEGTDYANNFVDLAALGIISDMCDYREIENRAIISLGLDNIKNPFFYYMCEKNEFSINKMHGINFMSIAFYVTPFINAIVRSGTMEEKDLIFKSFLQMYAFDKVESGKRGHKGELVPRVEEAVRVAANVKARQTKLQDNAMELLESKIKEEHLQDNAIIVLTCEPGEVERNIAGLTANKVQAKYQHPTLVLTKTKTPEDEEYFYRGSARNYSMSENQDLRQVCLSTGLTEYCTGHANAFGCSIPASKLQDFIAATNNLYRDIPNEPVYWVDFVWNKNTIDGKVILDIADSFYYWGQNITEPYICIKDLPLNTIDVRALAWDKNPTLKLHLDCGIDIMKFKSNDEELNKFQQENSVATLICRCNKNEWNGRITPQLIVENYSIEEKWIF